MILDMQFRLPPIDIILSNNQSVIEIALHVDGDGGHPISGFPRPLTKVEKKVIRHREALAAARPGTAMGTIRSGSGSGSASISIHSRSSKPWSPPDPGRHASIASAMSPTASTMSIARTISTTRVSENDNASIEYPQTPATTVTNQSFPIQGPRHSQDGEDMEDGFGESNGRETPQQRDYLPNAKTPRSPDYLPAAEKLHARNYMPTVEKSLPRDYVPPVEKQQSREHMATAEKPQQREYLRTREDQLLGNGISPRPPQLSLKLSQSDFMSGRNMPTVDTSPDAVNLPGYDNVLPRKGTEKRLRKDGPYELDGTPQGSKLSKAIYSPFPLQQRKSSTSRDGSGQPSLTPNNIPRQISHQLQVSGSNGIPRGDSPILGVDSDSSSKEEIDRFELLRSIPTTRQTSRQQTLPQTRYIREQQEETLSSYASQHSQLTRVDPRFRTDYVDPMQQADYPLPLQSAKTLAYTSRGRESSSGVIEIYAQPEREIERSDSGVKREMGLYKENQQRLQTEDGVPLEMRLRNLEKLVGKLEQENARIKGKGSRVGRRSGSISGSMK